MLLRNPRKMLNIAKQLLWKSQSAFSTLPQAANIIQTEKTRQNFTPGKMYNGFLCKRLQFIHG